MTWLRRKARVDRFALQKKAPGFIASPTGKRKAAKVTIKETGPGGLQAMAEILIIRLGMRFFRIPDSLLAYLASCPMAWIRVFVGKYLRGTPDLMLFKPLPGGDNVVRFIEIKTEAGTVSQGQAKWHAGLNVHVCYGWPEVEKAILDFHERTP